MSNEELAVLIQKGNRELLPELWDQVIRFCHMTINKYYCLVEMNTAVSMEDLIQEAYLGMEEAIEWFDPEKGSCFLTPLKWYVMKRCISALGLRGRKRFEHYSFMKLPLDAPIHGPDVKDITLQDQLEDVTLPEMTEALELEDLQREVREAIGRLPYGGDEIMRQHYLEGRSLVDIAHDRGVSRQRIHQKLKISLERLGRYQTIRAYADLNFYSKKGVQAFHRTHSSSVEDLVMKMETKSENARAKAERLQREMKEAAYDQEWRRA